MKNAVWLIIGLFWVTQSFGQDSLSVDILKGISYPFEVKDGRIIGEAAEVLNSEVAKAQYTCLGEYHGSKAISKFTQAFIPIADSLAYKVFALEVGPVTGTMLQNIEGDCKDGLHAINRKHSVKLGEEIYEYPIPFFEGVEDAEFLEEAKKRNWTVFGVDQEFLFGYPMLFSELFEKHKGVITAQRQASFLDSLQHFYLLDEHGSAPLHVSIKRSTWLEEVLVDLEKEEDCKATVAAFRATVDIYYENETRQWYASNLSRSKYMKSNLSEAMRQSAFDLYNDKMLVKMGGVHLARGYSRFEIQDLGNTLSELAAFHGNETLHITFGDRFYLEDGIVKDELDENSWYVRNYGRLLQIGSPDHWTLIDLRQLREGTFWSPSKYLLNDMLESLILSYDFYIIPPLEEDCTPN